MLRDDPEAQAVEASQSAAVEETGDDEMPRMALTRRRVLLFGLFVLSALAFLYFVLPKLAGLQDTWDRRPRHASIRGVHEASGLGRIAVARLALLPRSEVQVSCFSGHAGELRAVPDLPTGVLLSRRRLGRADRSRDVCAHPRQP